MKLIATSILIALLINLTVAWTAAVRSHAPQELFSSPFQHNGWLAYRHESRAATFAYAMSGPVPRVDPLDGEWTPPRWSLLAREAIASRTGNPSDRQAFFEEAYGWPFRCVVVVSENTGDIDQLRGPWQQSWTIPVQRTDRWTGSSSARPFGVPVSFPLRPLVLGLAGNTAAYLPVALLVVVASRRLIGTLRRRRGRCGACGHRLLPGQVACTECGWRPAP